MKGLILKTLQENCTFNRRINRYCTKGEQRQRVESLVLSFPAGSVTNENFPPRAFYHRLYHLIARYFAHTLFACRIVYRSLRPANLGVRAARGTSQATTDALTCVYMFVYVCVCVYMYIYARTRFQWSTTSFPRESRHRGNSIVRPRVPNRRDHVRGRRVFRASLLHVIHQRAVLAFIRVEIRLLTACHAATVSWIHLLQMIQRLA